MSASIDPPAADPIELVPSTGGHQLPPCEAGQIAWQYLLPEARMQRWAETVQMLDFRRSRREITIDFTLPAAEEKPPRLADPDRLPAEDANRSGPRGP